MRAVIQRVAWAKVAIDGVVVGSIDAGLLVYLGIGKDDEEKDRAWMLDKTLGLRIFSNDAGKMDRSVRDVGGALLVVSQFTLFGDTSRGRRPGFDGAMPPGPAREAYEAFLREAAATIPTSAGRFGADMLVTSANDGPVTLWLDSRT